MKEMLERICHNKQVVFTSLDVVDPQVLHTRKKLSIFSGVDHVFTTGDALYYKNHFFKLNRKK